MLFIIPLMGTTHAFVKDTHRFVRTANLHLHKVGRIVMTRWTNGVGAIHVFPGRRPTQNVVHLLALTGGLRGVPALTLVHGAGVGTGGTVKVKTGILSVRFGTNLYSNFRIY